MRKIYNATKWGPFSINMPLNAQMIRDEHSHGKFTIIRCANKVNKELRDHRQGHFSLEMFLLIFVKLRMEEGYLSK